LAKARRLLSGLLLLVQCAVGVAITCKEWPKPSWRHLRAANIVRLPVEIASPQGQSNRRSLARSIEILGYALSGHGVNQYVRPRIRRTSDAGLNGIHQDQVISEAQFADLIDTCHPFNKP
jgi:hypothetical protein